MSETQVDLSRLALDRSSDTASAAKKIRRKWISRYLIPAAIIAGFLVLLAATTGSALWPKPSVEVTPVIVKIGTAEQSEGTPLFQAAGWIEPRPTPLSVPSLASGVIEDLLVVEGQSVEKAEPIARLISVDAEIAVQQAKADLAASEGELERAIAERRAARIRLEQPVHLRVQLADAKSDLAKVKTLSSNLPYQIEAAKAQLEYAKKSYEGKQAAGDSIPGVTLRKAQAEYAAADSRLRELEQRAPSLGRELEALQEKVSALETQLNLLVEEKRQLAESEAKVQSATSRRNAAKLHLQKAELELERTTIRSPIEGRILSLVASPGIRVTGLQASGSHDSSIVVTMYDPDKLQVRADVRLEDVPSVQPGQPVEIETASSEKTIFGTVLQSNSTANIQKNTLEVKVALSNPPPTIRPEMLVKATFLAPKPLTPLEKQDATTERLFIPSTLVQSGDSQTTVWVVDSNGRARQVNVEVGAASPTGLVEVKSGLKMTDKLIKSDTSNLSHGSLVEVVGGEGPTGG